MQTEAAKKLFTVDKYYKMADAGILGEHDRTELIEGEVIEMSAMGAQHAAVVARVNDVLVPLFKGKALLRPQFPLRLNDFNEPQPDIVLLKPRRDYYSLRHPGPADVFLVLEISDSSLEIRSRREAGDLRGSPSSGGLDRGPARRFPARVPGSFREELQDLTELSPRRHALLPGIPGFKTRCR